MLRLSMKCFLFMVLVSVNVFAGEPLSDEGGYEGFPEEQQGQDDFFVLLEPMYNQTVRYLGVNFSPGLIHMKPEITKDGVLKSEDKRPVDYGIGVYGGMGHNFGRFYLGGDLKLSFSALSDAFDNVADSTRLIARRSGTASFDIMPGYFSLSRNVLCYGRLGIEGSLFNLKFEDYINHISKKNNKIIFGWRAGLGVEFFLNESLSLRTEYVYISYSGRSDSMTGFAGAAYDYKTGRMDVHQFNLGLGIHF